jgi:copper chaperone CopZ
MKAFTSLFAVALTFLIMGCSGPAAEQSAVDVPVVRKSMESEVNKSVANLAIEGMTCSAGCGGKIQQELRALEGVKLTELDFAEGRAQNVVSVEFDPAKISEKDMIQCVSKIADGMYQVKGVELVDYKGIQTSRTSGDAGVRSNDFGKLFQLLNLLETLTAFLR